jgi:hypothetical protein
MGFTMRLKSSIFDKGYERYSAAGRISRYIQL